MEEQPKQAEESEPEPTVEPESFEPDPPEKVEQAERILREANLARVRGNTTVADRLLKEAQETAPNSAVVLEAIGDDLVKNGQFRKAKETYQHAMKLDPASKSIETKYGEMVLKVDLFIDPFTMQDQFSGYASPKIAIGLTIIWPGLGQMAVERYVKGGIMMALYIGSLVGVSFVRGGFGFLTGKAPFEPIAGVLLIVAAATFLWALVDLGSIKNKAPKRIDPPAPPSEWMNR